MSNVCYEVSPTSRAKLMALAADIRTFLRIEKPYFPILQVVELALPRVEGLEDLCLTIGEMGDMGDQHGLTFPERQEIRLRRDVYDGAYQGRGRDRFTLAHELGHLLLHSRPGLPRTLRDASQVEVFRSSEWQANTFAGSLLMPYEFLRSTPNLGAIAEACGVTIDAASTHTRLLRNGGLLR
jgi:hypothetical protein